MTDTKPDTGPDPEDTTTEETTEETTTKGEDEQEWVPPDRAAYEKLQRTAARRDAALRKAHAELAEARKGQERKDPDPADDPVAKANTKLVKAEVRTALAASGITDRADQKDVLDALNLSGIEVDDDGPDPDQVADLIDTLRRVFGGKAGGAEKRTERRTPRVDTRDRAGSKGEPADPDAARYRNFLTGGRPR